MRKETLTDSEKIDWFELRVAKYLEFNEVDDDETYVKLVRQIRKEFKSEYGKGVPGSFICRFLRKHNIQIDYSDGIKIKRDFMFYEMDQNLNYRDNKTQCRAHIEDHFKEKILTMIFDELWDEYHHEENRVKSKKDIDIHGQNSLF